MVSFEFFPTKTDEAERTLFDKTIPALRELHPAFCSVTYGAGGSTRDKTLGIVDRIQREHQITAMAHLTCVNTTADEIASVLTQARALGIKNILALRGDPPSGVDQFTRTQLEHYPDTLLTASGLVSTVSELSDVPGGSHLVPTAAQVQRAYAVAPHDIQPSTVSPGGTAMRMPVSAKMRLRISARASVIAAKVGSATRSAAASVSATKTLRQTQLASRLRATAASSWPASRIVRA